eukprot:m.248501 g.248501  ORF g.248501 m.248501 type:complete len:429 (-) comp19506_c0_seq4:2542-3828(-)
MAEDPFLDSAGAGKIAPSSLSMDSKDMEAIGTTTSMVRVTEYDRRQSPNGDFVAFKIESKMSGSDEILVVWRRYSDFELLRQYLVATVPSAVVPPIPEKTINFKLSKMGADKFDPLFLNKRQVAFHRFLRRCFQHETVNRAVILEQFCQNQKWRQFLTTKGPDGSIVPWKPGNVNDAMVNSAEKFDLWRKRGGKASQDDVDVEYHFCTDLRDNIASLLAIHIKYAGALQDLHVNLGEFGDTLSNMPKIGSTDLDPLYGKLGQHFDSLADMGPELLRRHEICFGDPMKEVAMFTDAVKEVLLFQERLREGQEDVAADIAAKEKSIEQWKRPEGVTGWFRSFNSKETQAKKIDKEEEELKQLNAMRDSMVTKKGIYDEKVRTELEKVNRERIASIKEIIVEFAKTQRQYLQKSLAYWTELVSACNAAGRV